jgi:hypothetical protein
MPAGRPKGSGTKYERKYCELIIEYFEELAQAETRELAPVMIDQVGEKSSFQKTEVRRICAELPTIEGFAVRIKIPSTTVRQWAKDHEEFAVAYARAKDIQRQLLVDRGLTRQYDPQAFAFVAKNITDMTDRQVLAGDPNAPLAAKLVLVDAGQDPPAKP